jgi:hypothetical protein
MYFDARLMSVKDFFKEPIKILLRAGSENQNK